MGVTRENKDVFFSPYIQEDGMQMFESGQSTDEEETHAHLPTTSARRHVLRGNRFRLRPRSASLEACLTGMYRRSGAKQARRTENIKYLLNLGDKDEEGEGTQSVTYNSTSAFAELFSEREKMQAWNDFINCSEEEQEEILAMGGRRHLASIREESDEGEDGSGSLDDSWEKVPAPDTDKRSAHPSYSAEECFQRIDKHLRSMLTRRHVPIGVLARLEEEVMNYFTDCPGSVYVSHVASSFERMLLHALCQFLGLHCRSYDEEGQRRTQVENKLPSFHPPSESLSQYLDRIS